MKKSELAIVAALCLGLASWLISILRTQMGRMRMRMRMREKTRSGKGDQPGRLNFRPQQPGR